MAKINSKYIKNLEWSQFNEPLNNVLNEQSNDSNFRILKINDYVNNIISIPKNYDFKKLLVESSNLFFLSVETVDKDFDNKIFKNVIYDILKDSGKYFLIEICHGSNDIVRFIFNGKTFEELLNKQLINFFEEYDNSLLQCCLNSSAFENLKNVSSNLSVLDSIAIRLIKTFDAVCPEKVEKTILKNFVCNSNVDAFRAFFDLPIIDDGESINHTRFTTKAIDYKYANDETLLFFAADGDFNMLKLLLRLGANVYAHNYNSETASDHTRGNYKNLKLLLEYDAKFPRKFHETYSQYLENCNEIQEEIRKMCVERQNLHGAIVAESEKGIESFEEKFPLLKFAYTFIEEEPYSRAATTTALKEAMDSEKDNFKTYLYLIDKGFCVNESDLYFMTSADKNKVSAIILNRLKIEQQSHITFLRGKTFVYGVDIAKQGHYKEKMKQIYHELNNLSELANILKIVEHSKALTVSVDFRSRSVVNLDIAASSCMDGLTYPNIGRIYLSAADKDDNEIAGILIHELMHFALHIVFNNNCRPYYKFDENGKDKFDKIVDNIKKLTENHDVVKNVYASYKKMARPKELIARVPQLIALKINEREREKYKKLFQFYYDNVLPYMQMQTSNPEDFFIKREVHQLSEFLRHTAEIENWTIVLDTTCLNEAIYDGKNIRKVVCDIPRLFLIDFYNEVVKKENLFTPATRCIQKQYEKYFIFASIEDFENSSTSAYIQRIWNLTSNITLILNIDKFNSMNAIFREKFEELLEEVGTSRNLIAFGQDRRTLDRIFNQENKCFILEYTWKHLDECSRKSLLSTRINFQGALVSLNELIDDDFSNIPMKKLINHEDIIIAASTDGNDYYDEDTFIQRCLKHCEQEYNTLDEVLSSTTNQITSVLLSALPGGGKSTLISQIACRLKDRNPNFWVARINIHQLTSASEDISTTADDMEIIYKHFVPTDSSPEREFELRIFKKLYDKSEVIFLFDSVVELTYECIEPALLLLKKLGKQNRLWITTQKDSPLKNKLTETLSNIIVFELQPFSSLNHVEYLIKLWRKELPLCDESKLKFCATKILQYYSIFIRPPKLTAIIAKKYICGEIHSEQ